LKKLVLLTFLLFGLAKVSAVFSQHVDSIYFHLYTDSLKKNIHNYISVDGKLSNGSYLPLDNKSLVFESTGGKWDGNSIYFDSSFAQPYVVITAYLKDKPEIKKSVKLYFKTYIPVENLKSEQELLDEWRNKAKKKKGTNES
jgi:hypothetical protein